MVQEIKGYYLNDYKDGLTYWEVKKNTDEFGFFVLELREKPAGELDGKMFYRRRMFHLGDIGVKIFETKEDALNNPERV